MKIIFNFMLLVISFNVFSADIFGVIVNDKKTSYFYSDVSTLNIGETIYYNDEKNPCCNQIIIAENKKGVLTQDITIDNTQTMEDNKKTYRFDIEHEMKNEENLVFLAWSSPLFSREKKQKININKNLNYSLCLTSEGVLTQLKENEKVLKSFYYYLGYDIEQDCSKEKDNFTDSEIPIEMINLLKKASIKLQENNFDWVYKNLFMEYITYQKSGDGSYQQLIDTEKGNIFYDWMLQSIYFILGHIEFDENNNLIKKCYNTASEQFLTSKMLGNKINYNDYCIEGVSLENEQLVISFRLKNDSIIYPEEYSLYIKHKSIDNSFRLYRFAIQ